MKFLKILLLLLVGFLTSQIAYAQEEESVELTEADDPVDEYYIDDIVKKRLIVENRILDYEPVREADIAWEKRIWRLLDTREKMNLGFMHPDKPFFNIVREHAESGDLTLFADEFFKEPLTLEEVNAKLNDLDTITDFDYDTYEEKIKIINNEINWEDIKRYRLKEIWYFDEEVSRMKVRITGIAPIREHYDDETGEFKYAEPLFWVYYPEAREFFAKHRVFNDFNDVAPMTWYDLFETRFFASFIYKKSNVIGLRLQDQYYGYDNAGIDRLLESERIKNELFNFEHDLWTY